MTGNLNARPGRHFASSQVSTGDIQLEMKTKMNQTTGKQQQQQQQQQQQKVAKNE